MKKIIVLFSLLLVMVFLAFSAEKKNSKQAVKPPFSRGVNFSQWLEFKNPDELDPYYFTKTDFENVKKMGVDVVRLPIHFEQFTSGAPDFKVNPAIWTILDNVSQWSTDLQLWVIFDFHNDTNGNTKTTQNIEGVLTKVWDQVSKRYANKAPYVCYEIYNEPHGIDKVKWGQIESKALETIRKNDKTRYIIVGGADWNSFEALKSLPNWNDSKLIYNFHFYEPFLFTHQGASWNDAARIKNVPFPYDPQRMPKLPDNPTEAEKNYLSNETWAYNYAQKGTRKAVEDFFDQYVEFSNLRNAPIYCGEYGVYMPYADQKERTNWYKIVTDCLDERNIARTSWDYYGSFGVFKTEDGGIFPQDLNKDVVEAMGFKVPAERTPTWFEEANKNKKYELYNNAISKGLQINRGGIAGSNYKKDTDGSYSIEFTNMNAYSEFTLAFGGISDFTELKKQNYRIEFMAKNENRDLDIQIRLRDSTLKCKYPWRVIVDLNASKIPADGKWHKVSIPLSTMADVGAWDQKTSTWIPSTNSFDWRYVNDFQICNNTKNAEKPIYFKDIKIIK